MSKIAQKNPLNPPARNGFTYWVSGRGVFPTDMLRYDCCWPATGEDVAKLDSEHRNFRSLCLNSHSEPTEARWRSFNWTVTARQRPDPVTIITD